MDIFELLDELETLGEKGDSWWKLIKLPGATVIDSERFFELTNEIRGAIPKEVSTADQITRDRDTILAEAHEERAKIVNAAKEQAAQLVSNDRVVQEAQERAAEVLRQAEVEARATRDSADQWAKQTFDRLDEYCGRVLATIEKTRRLMEEHISGREQAEAE